MKEKNANIASYLSMKICFLTSWHVLGLVDCLGGGKLPSVVLQHGPGVLPDDDGLGAVRALPLVEHVGGVVSDCKESIVCFFFILEKKRFLGWLTALNGELAGDLGLVLGDGAAELGVEPEKREEKVSWVPI